MTFDDDLPCPACGALLGPGEGGWPDRPNGPRYCTAACAAAGPRPRLRIYRPHEKPTMTRQARFPDYVQSTMISG